MNPGFDLEVASDIVLPPQDPWEEARQIVYQVPAVDSKSAVTIMRKYKKKYYMLLLEGANSGFGRRGARVAEVVESLKPGGWHEKAEKAQAPKLWTHQESRKLKKFIEKSMAQLAVPGAMVAITYQGKIVFEHGFGYKNHESREPVTVAIPFMIGSTTKPLTTLMAAKMVDQKRLEWSTPIQAILRGFKLSDEAATKKLTLAHSACACTGMPRRDLEFIFEFEKSKAANRILEMAMMKPTTDFGETFQYSNHLVMAGAYAVTSAYAPELRLEEAYKRAMGELVLTPLEMQNTYFTIAEARAGGAAAPHGLDLLGRPQVLPWKLEQSIESVGPAGGLWSTAHDLMRYVHMELAYRKTSNGGTYIGKKRALKTPRAWSKDYQKVALWFGSFCRRK